MTTAISPEKAAAVRAMAERELARQDFLYFLEFVHILEPPQIQSGRAGGKTKFVKWPHLVELAGDLSESKLIVVLKARQLGFSWLMASYAVWYMMFQDGAIVLMLSKGQVESKNLLKKAKFIYRNLPKSWQLPIATDSGSEFSLVGMESKIVALPATEDAGRSETASVVIQDEADFHEYLEANYTAVKPTIDAGGQLIMGSTSNKRKLTSLFKSLFRGAPANGFKALFFSWKARPDRDADWYSRTQDSIPSEELKDLSPELYMEQEYPGTAEEALAPSRSIAAFNLDVLKKMEEIVREPILTIGNIRIFEKRRAGGKYAAATDTSHGVGRDYAVTALLDLRTGRVVADVMSNTLEPEALAMESMKLLEQYGKPIWGIEDNDWGIQVIRAAQAERYPRLYKRSTGRTPGAARVVGWHTDNKSRWELWGELIEAVNAGQITVLNREGLAQFYGVIRNADKGGRPEAMEGANDDYPTAVGIAWQMRKYAYSVESGPVKVGALW